MLVIVEGENMVTKNTQVPSEIINKEHENEGSPENINIKDWVTKSNELIESTYKLTLQEQRILLVLASKVQPSDETLKPYKFRVRDFIDIIGGKQGTGFYSYMKEVVTGLQQKTLTLKKGSKSIVANWLITSIYEENEGYIILKFNPDLKHLLLELKEKFTMYQLENVVRLNSVYSIRIYELLKQYEKIRKREFTLEALRTLLGIEPNKYKQYGHFKSKVLLVSQQELREKTDIEFDFTEIKTGRKVTGILFNIKSNKQHIEVIEGEPKEEKAKKAAPTAKKKLIDRLISLGVTEDISQWIVNEFTEECILRNIDYVESRLKSGDNIGNVGGYTVNAIKLDYAQSQNKTKKPRKIIRQEEIPDNIGEQMRMEEILESGSLEEKQRLYLEKRKDQAAYEEFLIKAKKFKMGVSKHLESQEEIEHAGIEEIRKRLIDDIKKRRELGLKLQSIDEFKNSEIRKIYEDLIFESITF